MIRPFLVLSSVVVLSASVAFADSGQLQEFTYRVQVPAEGTSCETHAQEIAARFAQATQTQSVSAICSGRNQSAGEGAIDTIIVSYQAERIESPAQVRFEKLFSSYADCTSAIAKQQALFERETALTAVASYCNAEDQPSLYTLTIESFGEPKAYFMSYPGDSILWPDAVVTRAAAASLVQAGAVLAWSDDSRIYYYSQTRIVPGSWYFGTFANDAQCEIQKADAQGIYMQGGITSVNAFCDQGSLNLVGVGATRLRDDYGYYSAHYASFDECMGDKARAAKNVVASGAHLLGAICEPDLGPSNDFVIHFFY